ncbi:interleukin-6-like [Callorhinchus milii]|uniref:interleukin-6-like n=1 Tax=Callorhinchus milii TaxID=7868 RepID=UPI001C3FF0BB|nr:interleukin-6-like [Callorhinchus milii]
MARISRSAPGFGDSESLALQIRSTAAELRFQQLCDYFAQCDGDWSKLLSNQLHLPQIQAEDRCSRTNYHKQTCLQAIVTGLMKYKTSLSMLENSLGSPNDKIVRMNSNVQRLTELLTHQLTTEVGSTQLAMSEQEVSAANLTSGVEWDTQVKVHVILRDFTIFMEKTFRAIRFFKSAPRL